MQSRIVSRGTTIFLALMRRITAFWWALRRRLAAVLPRHVGGDSRADVPGWVLITLMSAVLVAGLLAIAGPALEGLFNQAMEQVQP